MVVGEQRQLRLLLQHQQGQEAAGVPGRVRGQETGSRNITGEQRAGEEFRPELEGRKKRALDEEVWALVAEELQRAAKI